MSLSRAEQSRSQRPEQAEVSASIYQAMDLARALVATAAGVPMHKVRIRITRPN
ncbi:hypothetical protein [Novosphingobium sp. JCM 18896]|uniref:hypothetical protein n=1 Tax=Novosphingobium sp. JCM 18896 TaxID=2989731 RepID=UPI002223B816|nr:hypothetical protein [Novosphingobium sp. JCM 18896]MCW1431044.1 hypothetical protein [Novosphingobium sp. JCM 18896]